MTEADRVVVRRLIASDAGVSAGSVGKVKQLVSKAHPEILQELRNGEIRIHRAWSWRRAPFEEQLSKLRARRIEKGLRSTAKKLISRQLAETSGELADPPSPSLVDLESLVRLMSEPESGLVATVTIGLLDAPGKSIFLTRELFQSLESQQESLLLC